MDTGNYFTNRFSRLYKRGSDYDGRKIEKKVLMENNRKEKRLTAINARRNIENVELDEEPENIPGELNALDKRRMRLIKWKKNKEEVVQNNKKTAKKPFVVGVVRHAVNSPLSCPFTSKRVTRSTNLVTERKKIEILFKEPVSIKPSDYVFPFPKSSKNTVFKFKANHASSSKKLTKPISPKFMRREAAKKLEFAKCWAAEKENENKKSSSDELGTPLSPPPRVTRSRTNAKQNLHPQKVAIVQPLKNKTVIFAKQRNIEGKNVTHLKEVASSSRAKEVPSINKPMSMKKQNTISLRSLTEKFTVPEEISSNSGPSTTSHVMEAVINEEEVASDTPMATIVQESMSDNFISSPVVTSENKKRSVRSNRPSKIIHVTEAVVSKEEVASDNTPMNTIVQESTSDNFISSPVVTSENKKRSVRRNRPSTISHVTEAVVSKEEFASENTPMDTIVQESKSDDFISSPFITSENKKRSVRRNRPSTISHVTEAVISKEEVPSENTPMGTIVQEPMSDDFISSPFVTFENKRRSVRRNRPSTISHVTEPIISKEEILSENTPLDSTVQEPTSDNFISSSFVKSKDKKRSVRRNRPSTTSHVMEAVINKEEVASENTPMDSIVQEPTSDNFISSPVVTSENKKRSVRRNRPSTIYHVTEAVISKEEVASENTPMDTIVQEPTSDNFISSPVVTSENRRSVRHNSSRTISHTTNVATKDAVATVNIPMDIDLQTMVTDSFISCSDVTPGNEKKSVSELNMNDLKDTDLKTSPLADFVLSPFVMTERGKKSTRRSNAINPARKKISLRDMPDPEEPDDGPTFQKSRLNKETLRLLTLAEDWAKIARLENLSLDIIDDIDLVVGQTKLLTRDKFQQFRNLIEQHEADIENIKVTVDDLNGFWDMMFLQVEDLNKKYDRLEVLKLNEWKEPELLVKQKSKRIKVGKPVISAKSSIRDFIKRKKVLSKEGNLINGVSSPKVSKHSILSDSPAAYNALRKSFTAKNVGTPPRILVTQSTSVTPKSCLKFKPEQDTLDKSVQKNVTFQRAVDFQDIPCKTPKSKSTTKKASKEQTSASRRSIRLQEKTPKNQSSTKRSSKGQTSAIRSIGFQEKKTEESMESMSPT